MVDHERKNGVPLRVLRAGRLGGGGENLTHANTMAVLLPHNGAVGCTFKPLAWVQNPKAS